MAVEGPVVMEKKGRKTPGRERAPLRPAAAREVMFGRVETGASPEPTAAFDPRLVLTKLATGKASREYRDKQAIFSQGDTADAVFYIQSGKVKLTVVSKRGKEAARAISRSSGRIDAADNRVLLTQFATGQAIAQGISPLSTPFSFGLLKTRW